MHRSLLEDRVPVFFREKEPLLKFRFPSARTELKAWFPWPKRVTKLLQGREIVTAEEVTNKNK